MKTVKVRLKKGKDRSYAINIGKGLLHRLPRLLNKLGAGARHALVCDSTTKRLFGAALCRRMEKAGMQAGVFSFPAGEKSKSLKTLESLENRMLDKGFDRSSTVIALGGGVTGDLGGFVAATYMRGIPLVQAPTTLLAMVDSSVGGKVAVDLPKGKNSCGAFHQPAAVFADLSCLKTLPEKHLREGMAEAVKHAVIADAKLFSLLEKSHKKIMLKNLPLLERVVKRNCEIKARIVERDERERNLRRIVNYGHTIGHALEVLGGYRRFSHGEAVSMGMAAEALLSHRLGFLSLEGVKRQNSLLEALGLPVALPGYKPAKIIKAMAHDKKFENGKPVFALPVSLGKMKSAGGSYGVEVGAKKVKEVLRELQ